MLKVVTAKEMQKIDRDTINKYGIPGTVLMERAGLAVVKKINEIYPKKKIIVLCGGGNNGGDGLVAARILHNQGRNVKVFLTSKPGDLRGDTRINYNAAKKFGVKVHSLKNFFASLSRITHHCLIVDALLGTGLSSEVRPPVSKLIAKINKAKCSKISIDIPSGISSDTGQLMGSAVRAQHTVSFGLPKRGHLLYPGAGHAGELHMEDIGFPRELLESEKIKVSLTDKRDIFQLMPERPRYSHKGTYGHVLLIAGSKGKTGAAFLAAKACLRTGAGLVTIGVPESLAGIFQSRVAEEMILPLPDKGNGTVALKAADLILAFLRQKANVLAIGPGISTDSEISRVVSRLIINSNVPIVIDADAINAITGRYSSFQARTRLLKKAGSSVILTPHLGEMARLMSSQQSTVNSQQLEKDRVNTAVSFTGKTKTHLVLKGVPTIVAVPDGKAFINSTGNPGMATAGTGDVLTGMISALLAQGLTPQNASIIGIYMHGLTADISAKKKGEHSLTASDIINAIPSVFKSIRP